jgi:hypothetical protein
VRFADHLASDMRSTDVMAKLFSKLERGLAASPPAKSFSEIAATA